MSWPFQSLHTSDGLSDPGSRSPSHPLHRQATRGWLVVAAIACFALSSSVLRVVDVAISGALIGAQRVLAASPTPRLAASAAMLASPVDGKAADSTEATLIELPSASADAISL